jgi:exodeoxyribonuclease VII large subunit
LSRILESFFRKVDKWIFLLNRDKCYNATMTFNDFKKQNMFEEKPLTVSQFIERLNALIRPLEVKVIGEVSEAKLGPTGHMYFSLKDEENNSVLSCAIWRSRHEMFGIDLKVGMKIVASGHAEIYAPNGRLSFICDSIELYGEGALKAAYDQLLKKLDAEGLFAPERKRPIPKYARRIGIITSKQGAVIHDFLNNIGKFGFLIELIDTRVEGQLAVGDILSSLRTFKKRQIDVLVIMRGGGSLEAMQAFNNEMIVREVAAFPQPVIAAIGHDKDVPLVAMAADAAVSTPTAAANLLTLSWQEIFRTLERYELSIINGYRNTLDQCWRELSHYARILSSFKYILENINRSMDTFRAVIISTMKTQIAIAAKRLDYLREIIESRDPQRQLELGYSIAKINGKVIKSAKNAKIGQELDVTLADGIINSQIKKIWQQIKRQRV